MICKGTIPSVYLQLRELAPVKPLDFQSQAWRIPTEVPDVTEARQVVPS